MLCSSLYKYISIAPNISQKRLVCTSLCAKRILRDSTPLESVQQSSQLGSQSTGSAKTSGIMKNMVSGRSCFLHITPDITEEIAPPWAKQSLFNHTIVICQIPTMAQACP